MRMLMGQDDPRIRLREPTDRFGLWLAPLFVSFAFFAGISKLMDGFDVTVSLLIGGILFAPATYFVVRGLRLGVYVTVEGLVVVNLFKTYRVKWSRIKRFDYGYPDALVWRWSPVAVLDDDSLVQLMPIQAPQPLTRPKNAFDRESVAALERFLEISSQNGGTIPEETIVDARMVSN